MGCNEFVLPFAKSRYQSGNSPSKNNDMVETDHSSIDDDENDSRADGREANTPDDHPETDLLNHNSNSSLSTPSRIPSLSSKSSTKRKALKPPVDEMERECCR
ncbi:hypothetical protein JTB14_011032 [Gonioctena quinquepunctata]|nr:hypothetical protein JTB14_011032 [Gonioctena quinquepunctata]